MDIDSYDARPGTVGAPTAEVLPCARSYRGESVDLVRLLEVLVGEVELELRWTVRFDSGSVIPWLRHPGLGGPGEDDDERIKAVAGPGAVVLRGPVITPKALKHAPSGGIEAGRWARHAGDAGGRYLMRQPASTGSVTPVM